MRGRLKLVLAVPILSLILGGCGKIFDTQVQPAPHVANKPKRVNPINYNTKFINDSGDFSVLANQFDNAFSSHNLSAVESSYYEIANLIPVMASACAKSSHNNVSLSVDMNNVLSDAVNLENNMKKMTLNAEYYNYGDPYSTDDPSYSEPNLIQQWTLDYSVLSSEEDEKK